MTQEKLFIAKRVNEKLEECKESILHIEEYPKYHQSQSDIYIDIGDGWGMQRIYIPKEAAFEVLRIVKESLIKKVYELERQFKLL